MKAVSGQIGLTDHVPSAIVLNDGGRVNREVKLGGH